MPLLARCIAAGALCCASGWAAAQPAAPAPPAPQSPATAEFQVTGFRSARFGMTPSEVRAAIERDFKPPPGSLTEAENPAEKTRALVLRLPSLDPVPAPALVTYIFSASGQRLFHVNVNWTTSDQPTEDERNVLAGAGLQLQAYFRRQNWKPNGTAVSVSEGPTNVLLFAGVDSKSAAVELHLGGVKLSAAGKAGADPVGPTTLKISYLENLLRRDAAAAGVAR